MNDEEIYSWLGPFKLKEEGRKLLGQELGKYVENVEGFKDLDQENIDALESFIEAIDGIVIGKKNRLKTAVRSAWKPGSAVDLLSGVASALSPPSTAVTSSAAPLFGLWLEEIVPEISEDGQELCIGSGTFGTVIRAALHGDPVCVKTLFGIGATTAAKAEFEQELSNYLIPRHPHVVQIFGACCIHSNVGIVLEYVAGGNLHNMLQRDRGTRFDWPKYLRFSMQIATGVTHLHSNDIIHRDLTSFNCLIDLKDGAKLCDFGLALTKKTSKRALSLRDVNKGTVLWMAPELFGRKPAYTEGSDVFGMSMIFVELCTRQLPWDDDLDGRPPTAFIPRWLDQGERPDLPATVPVVFRALIQMMWVQDVNARPSANECMQQLQAILHSAPSPASTAPALAPAPGLASGPTLASAFAPALDVLPRMPTLAFPTAQMETTKQARQGYLEGEKWHGGYGEYIDHKKAADCYRRAADAGYAPAAFALGRCFHNGRGVEKGEAEGSWWCRRAVEEMGLPGLAEEGDAAAQYCLGIAYEFGFGVAKDEAKGVQWWKKAAEKGHIQAHLHLGFAYMNGEVVRKDEAEAASSYWKAARQGCGMAQYSLGTAYHNGQGVAKDEAEAVRWWVKAAEQGNVEGQDGLGYAYMNGRGVPKDEAKGAAWYRKAAEQGQAAAQYHLGNIYSYGQGVPKNEAEAIQWWSKAAEQGNLWAQYNLGCAYMNGEGVPKDEAEGARWWRKAAEQGHANTQLVLGRAHMNGEGVALDKVEGARWCRKAAEQGHAGAQFSLGVAYTYGEGVAMNEVEAEMWLQKAAEQGHTQAQERLSSCAIA
jgi:TPR repeat protein